MSVKCVHLTWFLSMSLVLIWLDFVQVSCVSFDLISFMWLDFFHVSSMCSFDVIYFMSCPYHGWQHEQSVMEHAAVAQEMQDFIGTHGHLYFHFIIICIVHNRLYMYFLKLMWKWFIACVLCNSIMRQWLVYYWL